VAVVTPVLVPAVLDLPVLLAIEFTITNQSDSMSTKEVGRRGTVHTTLVCWEVIIDRECHIQRTIVDELSHDLTFTTHTVGAVSFVLVIGITL